MGFSSGWIAVRGKDLEAIHAALGLKPADAPPAGEPLLGMTLPSGWYVVVAEIDRLDFFPLDDEVLAAVSRGAEAITCSVVESTDFSAVARWKNGRESWSIVRNDDPDLMPPWWWLLLHVWPWRWVRAFAGRIVTGWPPRRALRADAVDVAGELVGFRHDGQADWPAHREPLQR